MAHPNQPQPREEEIDLREELKKYLRRWPLFMIGVVVCLAGAFLYLRYATPTYNSLATIIIKDEDKGGMPSELSAFADMGLMGGMSTSSIENELGILRSKRLMTNVVKELDLHVRYFQEGMVKTTELFDERPFNLQLLSFDTERFLTLYEDEEPEPLFFEITSDSTYMVTMEGSGGLHKKMNFGEALSLPYAEISVTPNFTETSEVKKSIESGPVKVTFSTVDATAATYRERLQINLTDKNSSLIELSLEDPVKDKARHLLDQLVYQYNREAIEDKNLVSLNTANFIEDRLEIITRELDSVETGKEQFKTENKLTDIEAESELFIENASEFRNRQLEVETQLELSRTMIEYLKSDEGGLLPSNLGFKEEGVVSIIQSYNQLVLERDRILAGSTQRNPVIVNLNNQINQIRANVLQSLNNLKTSLQIAKNDLDAQEAKINAQISKVPSKEKQFRNIERQQNIKEALYLYLLRKREETSLNLAVTAPKAKIVDSAYTIKKPVSPKPQIILLAALILGIVIPFLYIYLKELLQNKVESRLDLEKADPNIPIVGEVASISKKEVDVVMQNDRSILAEAFRILYTNLQYIFIDDIAEKRVRTILTTSTVKGEGKTMVSMNLALTIANTGKKVILVGADIRNPQLQRYVPNANRYLGVTEFLVDRTQKIEDLVQPSDMHENLSILLSGKIPPNPAELWRQGRTDELFETLGQQYDYIIIDSAPSLLVTDTFLINKYADVTLYVIRAGVTEKKMLEFPKDAVKDGKLHDVAFVLNDVDLSNFGYGNKYGYTYGEEQTSLWEKIKNKAAIW